MSARREAGTRPAAAAPGPGSPGGLPPPAEAGEGGARGGGSPRGPRSCPRPRQAALPRRARPCPPARRLPPPRRPPASACQLPPAASQPRRAQADRERPAPSRLRGRGGGRPRGPGPEGARGSRAERRVAPSGKLPGEALDERGAWARCGIYSTRCRRRSRSCGSGMR